MYTTYRLHTDELDMQFLEALKALFEGKTIEIVVHEVDETAYLLGSEANRLHLLQAVEQVNSPVLQIVPMEEKVTVVEAFGVWQGQVVYEVDVDEPTLTEWEGSSMDDK